MVSKFPTSRRKAVQSALLLAINVLQDERVRAQLAKAPVAARQWAAQGRHALGPGGRLSELDPRSRFGHRAIERRLEALQRNVRLVFPDPAGPDATAIYRAIDELDRAASIATTMPLRQRRRARARISHAVADLEHALVDALLI